MSGEGQAVSETIKDSSLDATTSQAEQQSGPTGANRRGHVRVRPDEKNRLAATLASGSDIRLIDLSKGGAQFECDRRFLPNASVSLRLVTRDGEVLVTGRVVRSRIVRLASGGLGYLVAVAFAKPLQTELETEEAEPVTPPAPRPARAPSPAVTAPAGPAAATPPAPQAKAPGPTPAPEPAVIERKAPAATAALEQPTADITAEEALAFEATMELAPAMLVVTASVDTTSEQLHDMFEGNDW